MQILRGKSGITLIALVITIIVLIIIAGISIGMLSGDNGILKRAIQAKDTYDDSAKKDDEVMNKLEETIEQAVDNKKSITITLDGVPTVVTKENYAEHLGKVVTNYTAPSSITINSNTYTVSTQYRLYFIDWKNKYKDGAGTIYLKADQTDNSYSIGTYGNPYDGSNENPIIKNLNPLLFSNAQNIPNAENINMKAVRWLADPSNWSGLKTENSQIRDMTNYVIGAPSLEMMVDSYNVHYNMINKDMDTNSRNINSPTTKLEYRFPFSKFTWEGFSTDNDYLGYGVGPYDGTGNQLTTDDGFSYTTSFFTINYDDSIGSMYNPDIGKSQETFYSWLCSPSAKDNELLMGTYGRRYNYSGGNGEGGIIGHIYYNNQAAFCPLVSLKPNVSL